MEATIRTERLCKNFGVVRAVSEVSLEIGAGEIYGFLGLNGAGKTTTIRMLLGMIRPSSGAAWIDGERATAANPSTWKRVGSLVESPSYYPDLTLRENLEAERRLRLVNDPRAVERVIALMNLGEYADRKAKHLSLGNIQRLGLAKALVHEPEILILDEPSNGLDPAGIAEIRELLAGLAEGRGVTIFVSSHILGEISKLASRIGIIHEGRLVAETDMARLDSQLRRGLVVSTGDNDRAVRLLRERGHTVGPRDDKTIELTDERARRDPADIATFLVGAGCPPLLLRSEEEDLESFFLRTIGRDGGGR